MIVFNSFVTEWNPCQNRKDLIFHKLFDSIVVEIGGLGSLFTTEFIFCVFFEKFEKNIAFFKKKSWAFFRKKQKLLFVCSTNCKIYFAHSTVVYCRNITPRAKMYLALYFSLTTPYLFSCTKLCKSIDKECKEIIFSFLPCDQKVTKMSFYDTFRYKIVPPVFLVFFTAITQVSKVNAIHLFWCLIW